MTRHSYLFVPGRANFIIDNLKVEEDVVEESPEAFARETNAERELTETE